VLNETNLEEISGLFLFLLNNIVSLHLQNNTKTKLYEKVLLQIEKPFNCKGLYGSVGWKKKKSY
jgi:hypothetical protein